MQNAGVGRAAGRQTDFVVRSGTESVVSRTQPLEPRQCQPAVGLLKLCGVSHAPSGEVLLPASVLRPQGPNTDHQRNEEQCGCRTKLMETHAESILAEAPAEYTDLRKQAVLISFRATRPRQYSPQKETLPGHIGR